ncbi:MAG: aminopeptidase [Oscillospiraceae bacterium]|nr:aminopeptidase [Oscillospiraceae bacterium]
MENLKGKELQKMLTYSVEHIAKKDESMVEKSFEFCEGYMDFLTASKTERLAAANILEIAKANGYTEFDPAKTYKAGDKVYVNNRDRAVILSTLGQKTVDNGVSIVASHIDCPRLDLKPNPLYESNEIAYFKTHYYGGVKRYQWAATPLALHGVVIKTNGEKVDIHIGEEPTDPVFCLSDLLPHLAKDQAERKMRDVIRGEEMNIILGSLPYQDEEIKDAVKMTALVYLYEKYGITERELLNAELQLVPAGAAKDVGFDRSLIGSYGHDDRVCAYTSLMAEVEAETPDYTTVTVFADKEEVGSDGVAGLHSDWMEHFITYLAQMQGVNHLTTLGNSKCLSADVNAAYDPTFPDVMDPRNSCYLNKGVVITKYTGAGGKSGTNDSTAEFFAEITNMLDAKGLSWQTGELGKVDQGGGGTVAKFVSQKNIDTVDIGVPVLSMHAPFELVTKLDVYSTYQAFVAFINR